MNAVVGQKSDCMVVGGHGLKTRNEKGRLLIEFCQRNKLCIMNTWFKQPKRQIYTWKASGDCNRYQMNYIFVQNRYKNSVKNVHAYPGADANSDLNMVMIKVRLRLKRPHRTKQRVLWDKEALKNCETVESFNKEINNALAKKCNQINDVESQWLRLKEGMMQEAIKTVGKRKEKFQKKPWVTEEMIEKLRERRWWKGIATEEGRRMYSRMNNTLRRETDKAKKKWFKDRCSENEELEKKGQLDLMYHKVEALLLPAKTWKKTDGCYSG